MRLSSSLLKLWSRNLSGYIYFSCESSPKAFQTLECFGTFLLIRENNNRAIVNARENSLCYVRVDVRDQARERALTGEESRHEQAVEEEGGALTRGLGTLQRDNLESMLQVRPELDINNGNNSDYESSQ